jgi:anti-sigma B factor antagonist
MFDAASLRSVRAQEFFDLGDLTIISTREAGVHTVSLFGELDLASAGDVQVELERVEASDAESIVVDLAGLTFIDSTGVRLVYNAHVRLGHEGGRLALLRGSEGVQRLFQLTALEDQLPFVG